MPETCDEPGCAEAPVFTLNIFRRQPAGVLPHLSSTYHDVCADHAVFKAIQGEIDVRNCEEFDAFERFEILRPDRP